MHMHRIDLYVSPEEYAVVRALGARWDEQLKCWYIDTATQAQRFARWLGDARDADPTDAFAIQSVLAYVASAAVPCCRCRRRTQVICIYCRSGTAWEEPLEHFTVQNIRAIDTALSRQLERWPWFRPDARFGGYVNHCAHCNASQPDADLHSEPHQPFYDVPGSAAVVLTPLCGPIRLSADYSVEV